MNIVFMGTPDFAVPCLDMLHKKYGLSAVYTKIDKVNQRGNKINFSPVKKYAIENNIKVIQPNSFKIKETIEELKELNPDLIVVVAYGKILPKEVINLAKYGIINVHSSLLPKYRGAAPIHYAIINGDEKTGVSIMYIDEELDAGDVILQKETEIKEEDNLESLHDRLAILGKEALEEAVEQIFNNTVKSVPQEHSMATFVKPIRKEECQINWNMEKEEIFNKVRGMNPFPTAFTLLDNKIFKIYEVEKSEQIYEGENGEIVDFIKNKGPVVKVKNASLIIKSAKPENKKIISGTDLINGNYFKKGDILN